MTPFLLQASGRKKSPVTASVILFFFGDLCLIIYTHLPKHVIQIVIALLISFALLKYLSQIAKEY